MGPILVKKKIFFKESHFMQIVKKVTNQAFLREKIFWYDSG